MDKLIQNVRSWRNHDENLTGSQKSGRNPKISKKTSVPKMTRSSYSLVSCSDLTPGSLAVWLELPDQIKYDPSLAPFRQLYEREHGTIEEDSANEEKSENKDTNENNNLENGARKTSDKLHVQPIASDLDSQRSGHHSFTEDEKEPKTLKEKIFQYIKLTCLIGCWIFFTVLFVMYEEYDAKKFYTSVAPMETKEMNLTNHNLRHILLIVDGPFITETHQKLNEYGPKQLRFLTLWMEGHNSSSSVKSSEKWHIQLKDKTDFSQGIERSKRLKLESKSRDLSAVMIKMSTNSSDKVAFTLEVVEEPVDEQRGVAYAFGLLLMLYALIIFELINRALAAVIVSTLSLAVLAAVGLRPSMEELISWLDSETLLLLFSMMLLVAILTETGLFDFVAVFVFSVTKGKTWPLINLLCFFTAILSTFLDNVTTVLLMTPVTIRLCEVIYLNPVPVLMAMVIYSNIGGTATPVGDPPNVIIASNGDVVASGITFTTFTLHMTVGILLVAIQTYLQLRYVTYRKPETLRQSAPPELQELKGQIGVWKRAASSLATVSKDEEIVRNALSKKIKKLTAQLSGKIKENKKQSFPSETFQTTLDDMKEKYKIKDKLLLVYSVIAITFVVAVFFLHSIPELQRISLGWTALLGAILLLILADREDLEPILHRIEWSTLLFFAALFVLMEALSKLGLIQWIGELTEGVIMSVEEKSRLTVAILLLLWVSGLASAFVDNIPLTTMMVRIVTRLGNNPALNLPLEPLIWSLSFGACLGGNGTLIGASANVVTAGVAEQHGYKFTFMQFFKVGFPLMIGHLIVSTGYLLMAHCVFEWH